MHKFKELLIWKEGMEIAKLSYIITSKFPKQEQYGLTSQIQRSAVSIPSNISEGAGRNSNKEFLQFIAIANGSSFELETQLLFTADFGYVLKEDVTGILNRLEVLQKMMNKFSQSLKSKSLTTNI